MDDHPIAVLAMFPRLTEGMILPAHLERLRRLCSVPDSEPLPNFADPRAPELLADARVLLSGWGCPSLDEAFLDLAPNLGLIAHAAGTIKNHVTDACFDRGVRVVGAAAANALPVAEYTLAAILMSGKRAFRLQRQYQELRGLRLWGEVVPDPGNFKKVVGIVGASHIGRRVIELLGPFDYQILLADPTLEEEQARGLGARLVSLDDLLSSSDIVSLHAPSLPETRRLLDRRRLALMRDNAVLINTARGALVDHEALTQELISGRIDAVIDTTAPELLPKDSPLYELPNVFLTPHIAGALDRERERMTELVLDEIERYLRGEPLHHEIRRDDIPRIA